MFTKARIILGFFAVIGLLMLMGGSYFYLSGYSQEKSGILVTGQIIDLSVHRSDDGASYCPVVKYTDGQEEYVMESSYCSSGYHNAPGDDIDVIYQPGNPDNAVIHSFGGLYGGAVILLGMGAVFALVGTLPLIIMYLRSKSGQRLLREGMPVKARFSEVILNTTININGRSPFQIVAQMHDTAANTVKLYYSHNIAFDPSPFINQEFVTVYVDTKNPDKYYMDISFLPKVK
ncbi:DUF3592 domain-containing protein [Morganella morganii]|uniref:DUF3592 domain-containing protein n=1 Tax=Morganella morganii TaxID=582 RepID=UPI00164643F1|nr:DUF3592 domain-containing protein [Morganella morganii]HDS2969749.1 DUF3592 domain-containing protein [Morganella morganii subsp. morganii]MBC3977255.1 DUF3592 domain-containing protein [Morganella morganii]HCR3204590.1 DUF3592 domain-containing protein [Morganella morganii]HCT9113118.1 DUF3592 domain-containing protein [Morganella morganii]HDU8716899.1 DUF3592 domain-containing protein [Morganella morganii subsp. morganii]